MNVKGEHQTPASKRPATEMLFSPETNIETLSELLDKQLQPLHDKFDQVLGVSAKVTNLEKEFIYLFGGLRRFQHCTGHITTGSWMGRGNQYIQFVRVLYCKLPTNGKQLPAFPLEAMLGIEPRPQRWEARVLPLCHLGPYLEKEIQVLTEDNQKLKAKVDKLEQ